MITYGTIQVSLAVTGTRVTGCWASYPTSSDSGPINSSAIPRLCSEAIAAQSATIASVSGASATSPAFKSSLQSALTRAGI
ncbi:MAG: FMN-binding protein [Actinobacteria bacterium]|nr:FMN-binding protein [Actinomycetota bacterium]